jgi:hypothetical protein
MFIGPQGQQKNVFLRVLRDLRGSIFSFLTARSLRSLKIAKTAKKTDKNVFLALQANQKGLSSRPPRSSRFKLRGSIYFCNRSRGIKRL